MLDLEEKYSMISKNGVSILFTVINLRLRRRWLAGLLVFFLFAWPYPAQAEYRDSWMWRLDMERLTQEALLAKAQTQGQLYRVQKGDTLWGLARRLGTDLELLAAMNYLQPQDTIYAGQYLRLPVEPDKTYQVRPGDTLWRIARQFDVDVKTLMAANRITQPEKLQVGTVLTIPGSPWSWAVSTRTHQVSRVRTGELLWPVHGSISSPYGPRSSGFHHGLDIAAPKGTPVRAAQAGVVRFSGYKNAYYGNAVEIVHDNGMVTVYGHHAKNLVKKGQRVTAGQVIAEVGATGRATGPHVHFEVWVNGKTVDPLLYLK